MSGVFITKGLNKSKQPSLSEGISIARKGGGGGSNIRAIEKKRIMKPIKVRFLRKLRP
jgi:hypothetical protein